MRSFTDLYLPDTDNIVLFENTTPINENKEGEIKGHGANLTRLVEVVFSKGTMLSVSDKSKSVNERTIQINKV